MKFGEGLLEVEIENGEGSGGFVSLKNRERTGGEKGELHWIECDGDDWKFY